MGFLPLLLAPALAQLYLAPAVPPAAAPSYYYPTAEAFPAAEAAELRPAARPEGPRLAPACLAVAALGAVAALVRLPGKAANAPFQAAASSSLRRSAAISMMASDEPNVSKEALVDAVAKKAGVSKKTASEVLAATLDVIVDSVSEGSKVSLIGFGTFRPKDRPAREARNPKTGEKMMVAAKTVPTFTFGTKFKEAVKEANAK